MFKIFLALSILSALLSGEGAYAQPVPEDGFSFFVVNFTGVDGHYHTSDNHDPILAEKRRLAEHYLQNLQQIRLPKGVALHLVDYEICSGMICGEFLPVAGRFAGHDSARGFCAYASSTHHVPCKVEKISTVSSSQNLRSYALCSSVKEWCRKPE